MKKTSYLNSLSPQIIAVNKELKIIAAKGILRCVRQEEVTEQLEIRVYNEKSALPADLSVKMCTKTLVGTNLSYMARGAFHFGVLNVNDQYSLLATHMPVNDCSGHD